MACQVDEKSILVLKKNHFMVHGRFPSRLGSFSIPGISSKPQKTLFFENTVTGSCTNLFPPGAEYEWRSSGFQFWEKKKKHLRSFSRLITL
jgi:hypothetical protein